MNALLAFRLRTAAHAYENCVEADLARVDGPGKWIAAHLRSEGRTWSEVIAALRSIADRAEADQ